MDINYENIFKTFEREYNITINEKERQDLSREIGNKLTRLETVLYSLNDPKDPKNQKDPNDKKITATQVRMILALYGYKICF